MSLETPTYISDLVSTNPTSSDPKSVGDDHIRNLKIAIKATFPSVTNAVTATHTELNQSTGKTLINTADAQSITGQKTFTAPILGTPASGTLTNCAFPTLNQNTTGTANTFVGNLIGDITSTGMNTTLTTATVGSKVAGLLANTIGSYALLKYIGGIAVANDVVAGGSLLFSSAGDNVSGVPTGTWRCMGYSTNVVTFDGDDVTLWVRIT